MSMLVLAVLRILIHTTSLTLTPKEFLERILTDSRLKDHNSKDGENEADKLHKGLYYGGKMYS